MCNLYSYNLLFNYVIVILLHLSTDGKSTILDEQVNIPVSEMDLDLLYEGSSSA